MSITISEKGPIWVGVICSWLIRVVACYCVKQEAVFSYQYFAVDDPPQHTKLGLKEIVHFEIKIWYLSAYPKGIQDVGVFFSSVDPILMFLGQTFLVCQSYNGRYRLLSL